MKKRMIARYLIGGIAMLLLVVSVQAQAQTEQVVQLPFVLKGYPMLRSGQVVFQSYRDGDVEIYRMDYDGSDVIQLTNNTFDDVTPDWSPDGSKIAYLSNETGEFEVYVMDADGTNSLQLTDMGHCDSPQWSPDGKQIAFYSRQDNNNLIFTFNLEESSLVQITAPEISGYDPYWSPDGSRIAFISSRTTMGVYDIDAEGTTPPVLLFEMSGIGEMAWSPDGQWFAITKVVEPNFNLDIFLYDLDTSTLTRLTTTTRAHNSVDWYPGGNYLIYQSNQDDLANFEIYTMTISGTMIVNISNHPAPDSSPDWIP